MVVTALTHIVIGIFLTVLGLVTWKKRQINILHEYHYRNVKTEDVPAYTRSMGIGQIIIGSGLCLTGILILVTESTSSWMAFTAGFIAGMFIMHRAQMKYNGGWFS